MQLEIKSKIRNYVRRKGAITETKNLALEISTHSVGTTFFIIAITMKASKRRNIC